MDETIGVKLFTLMEVDHAENVAWRNYTNMPEAYPVLGKKPRHQNRWSEVVDGRRETFVANSIDEIAEVFDDHELIRSLGCESVLNLPIFINGELRGALNCLHEAGYYTPERVTAAQSSKPLARWPSCWPKASAIKESTMGKITRRVATDVGGTFTDLVCFETDADTGESRVITAKSDTTPPDFETGVLKVLEKGGVDRPRSTFSRTAPRSSSMRSPSARASRSA
ncbi:MAG: hydantoinase/oxoprolinase N-terminal domain-containing protein [Paracoccaceae bacterium]